MFDLTNCLNTYLSDRNNCYAILIDGDWGSGKTYFIKEFMNSQNNKNIVYLSLAKIDSLSMLEDKIYEEIFKKVDKYKFLDDSNNLVKKCLKDISKGVLKEIKHGILKKYHINIDINYIKELYKQRVKLSEYIFIFDDLERAIVEIKDLLGYISDLLEQKNTKVIVIANESKIIEKEKEYKKIKEKTIMETYKFNQKINVEKILENTITIDDNMKYRFEKFKGHLNRGISVSSRCNIRTLKYFLIKSWNLFNYDTINEIIKTYDFEIQNQIYRLIFIDLYKKIKEIKEQKEKKENDIWPLDNYYFSFYENYLSYNKINENKFREEIDKYIKSNEFPMNDNNLLKDINLNWYLMEDDDIKLKINSLMENLSEKKYEIQYFERILYLVNKINVLGFNIDIELIIKYMIKKINESNHKLDLISTYMANMYLENESNEYREVIKNNLIQSIEKLNEEIKRVNKNLDYSKFRSIKECDYESWIKEKKDEVTDLFSIIEPRDLIEVFKKMSNSDIYRFRQDFYNMTKTNTNKLKESIELIETLKRRDDIGLIKKEQLKYIINEFKSRSNINSNL